MVDTPFNVLMQQASALKGARQAPFRKKFDSFPVWYQHSYYAQYDKEVALRKDGNFEDCMSEAQKLKEMGNELVTGAAAADDEGMSYQDAVNKYERALSIWEWLRPTYDTDWRKEEIADEHMVQEKFQPTDEPGGSQLGEVRAFRLKCLLNLAHCYLKQHKWKDACDACDTCLDLDPRCAKALYRRAQARVLPGSAGAVEQEQALADLKRAHAIDPVNKDVHALKLSVVAAQVKQRERDNTVKGFLDRPNGSTTLRRRKGSSSAGSNSSSGSSGSDKPLTTKDVMQSVKDLETAATRLEADGKISSAEDFRKRAQACRTALDQHRQESRSSQIEAAKAAALEEASDMTSEERAHFERLLGVMGNEVTQETSGLPLGATDADTVYERAERRIAVEDAIPRAKAFIKDSTTQEMTHMMSSRIEHDPMSIPKETLDDAANLIRAANHADPALEGLEEVLVTMLAHDLAAVAERMSPDDPSEEVSRRVTALLEMYGDDPPTTRLQQIAHVFRQLRSFKSVWLWCVLMVVWLAGSHYGFLRVREHKERGAHGDNHRDEAFVDVDAIPEYQF